VHDHHRTMIDGKPPEAALELVAIDDRARAVRLHRLIPGKQAHIRRQLAGPASLGVAGAHEESVRPGVEARRVAELRKVLPDGEQRLLRRVLGEVDVAQDPVRHRMETVAARHGEACKCPFVAMLRPCHEIGIHASSARVHRFRSAHSHGMGRQGGRVTQSSAGCRAVVTCGAAPLPPVIRSGRSIASRTRRRQRPARIGAVQWLNAAAAGNSRRTRAVSYLGRQARRTTSSKRQVRGGDRVVAASAG
jgi:hypothetical protein